MATSNFQLNLAMGRRVLTPWRRYHNGPAVLAGNSKLFTLDGRGGVWTRCVPQFLNSQNRSFHPGPAPERRHSRRKGRQVLQAT
jgi:hypothetical protein